MSEGFCRLLTLLFLFVLLANRLRGAEDSTLEYRVKAAFLLQFSKFVEWPASAMPATNSPVVIGLLAEDPVGPIVRAELDGKLANGRLMVVKFLPDIDTVESCHMLFLSRAQKDRANQLLAQAQGKPILTVSEVDRFALQGGVMNFVRKDESFRFEVNLQAAEKARLKISAKLAGLATVVKPRK